MKNLKLLVSCGELYGLKAMNAMQELMQSPDAMKEWFEAKRREFEALPENE